MGTSIRMFFDIQTTAISIFGYNLSYVELIGTFFGLFAVYWASKANILTWPASIINEAAFFLLFFQVHLYSDMLLQVFFFVATLYGWYNWKSAPGFRKITTLSNFSRWVWFFVALGGTLALGTLVAHIHQLLPSFFPVKASFAYPDAFTTTASMIATILLARKKIENWLIWMVVDVVCIFLYFIKGIQVVAVEYFIFLILCIFGWYNWKKIMRHG